MTGEMSWIKANGDDSNGESWPVHAEVARALRCRLRPFDYYIGPFIAHQRGRLWLSSDDGYTGTACLWPNGAAPAYCEPITCSFPDAYDAGMALEACREVLKEARRREILTQKATL